MGLERALPAGLVMWRLEKAKGASAVSGELSSPPLPSCRPASGARSSAGADKAVMEDGPRLSGGMSREGFTEEDETSDIRVALRRAVEGRIGPPLRLPP